MRRLIVLFALIAAPLWASPDPARLSLLPGWRTPDGTVMAALRVQLAPGWKTYWRAPGDAGIPPRLDWSGSDNLRAVRIHWPTPLVLDSAGMRIIAYRGDVVIPLELTPEQPGPVTVSLDLEMGLCEHICMPVSHSFHATIDPGTRRNPAIVAALIDRPARARGMRCDISPGPDGVALVLRVPHAPAPAVIESPGAAWVSEPTSVAEPGGMAARAMLQGAGLAVDRSQIRLTLLPGAGAAVEYLGCE